MSVWAQRKRNTIVGIFALLIFVFLAVGYFLFAPAVSCTDGTQNQNEQGVDCGGVCKRICSSEARSLSVLWTRPVFVDRGVYSVVAYISNSNVTLGARAVPYRFKLYDDRNLLIYERAGSTDVPANTNFAVFEGSITTGNRIPSRAFFEFAGLPTWFKVTREVPLKVRDVEFSTTSTPRLSARLLNQSLQDAENIKVTALLFDGEDNVIAASETHIDRLIRESDTAVIFTWPNPFSRSPSRIEIDPRLSPRFE